ncbi:transposase [Acaryochloris sp. 'Moss Beach']|nr:transposase [Acaryochloris sp. 'Moss Beach']
MLVMNYRYRIYPNFEQEQQMLSWLETCRRVFNYALRERKDWINSRKCPADRCSLQSEYIVAADALYPSYYAQKKGLAVAKKENNWLKAVHSQVLQEVIGQLDGAFTSMKERGHGFPRFKKFGQYRSFLFPQFKSSPIQGRQIKLPKIGLMPIVFHRQIPDGFAIKTVRVIRKHSGWYISLCLVADVSIPEVPPHGRSIGINVGLSYFLSTSDGEQVDRPRFFDKLHRKLELLQRCLKRKQKRSNNRAKLIQRIGRVHEQIAASRLDWQFKLAHHLCDQAQMIFAEDLDFRIMAKGLLGKHTLDAGLGQFLNVVLPWVCFKRGVYYAKVDPNGTSQECPDCGARVKKDLSMRIHECHECGSVKPRDVASGQVINARGLSGIQTASGRDLSGYQGTDARQDRTKLEELKSNLEKPALYASA